MTIVGILRDDENFVITSLEKKFSGTWRPGEKNKSPDAYLSIGAREIAVEISRLTQRITDDRGTRPRLSDDMPAIKLVNRLNAELHHLVPDSHTIVLALNAPILEVRKTKGALTKMLRQRLPNVQSFGIKENVKIYGNAITISRHHRRKPNCKKISGIVASPRYSIRDILSNRDIPFNARYILQERIAVKTEKCAKIRGKNPLWLALFNDYPLADVQMYKDALSQCSLAHPFEKILLVSSDGTVDQL